ncbi:MAG: 6-carboxytetrahydropterin synthase QueD [Chloroflexi bacterium 13_1_20CM_50_12]|nr:MAG: 6-carboxytetrahydropterin synthase QueD [Chloroflexi bacterium 13_1_20CM_50_12]OLE52364.1 MAG: 6-carboxytetrahydropterin synthase QueD [Acidobacteria bacterium 13_1_20CM_3_53_8]
MKVATITKIFRFESAHHLPGHHGKCARPHGHSYRLEVTIRGPIKEAPGESDNGMVMDFGDLSQLVKNSVIEHLDHQDLNVVTGLHTTAENLAHWIWGELTTQGLSEALLYRIRLWETESSFVEITQQERN